MAWIVDLKHFLDSSGSLADLPAPARRLAEYFTTLVVDATSNQVGKKPVRCRRRPRRKPCSGIVQASISFDEEDRIDWRCPSCSDNGIIRGWTGSVWDGLAHQIPSIH